MFLLGFLLISAVSAEITQDYVDNYILIFENRVRLNQVLPTNRSSDSLDLSGYPTLKLVADCFKEAKGLKRISFKNVDFTSDLPHLVFRFLPDLEYLGLENSQVRDVRYAFYGLSNLRELNLKNTSVQLRKGMFFGLSNRTKFVLEGSNVPSLEPSYFLEPYPLFRVRIINGIVQWLDRLQTTTNVRERSDVFLKMTMSKVSLSDMGIQGFEKGWFRIFDVPVTGLSFESNNISDLTSGFLNDLPEDLQELNLSWNNITSVERGVFDNLKLRHLDLSGNLIDMIDFFAFAHTRLTSLRLDLNLATTMPQTLEKLTLRGHAGNYKVKFEDYSDDEDD